MIVASSSDWRPERVLGALPANVAANVADFRDSLLLESYCFPKVLLAKGKLEFFPRS